jgi:hypothetical protein
LAVESEQHVTVSSSSVILSEAKDLMPVASGDEVLRFSADLIRATQDDD